MADYGSPGGGRSLRDALNEIMPMYGMGQYGAMFPPQTGGDQPAAPVPIPQPRPPMPPQMGLPPQGGVPLPPQRPLVPPQPALPQGAPQPSYAQRLGLTGGY